MKEGLYKVVEGNQIPCKPGRYEVVFSSHIYGESRGRVSTQNGGFSFIPHDFGQIRFFEEPSLTVKEDGKGFIVKSDDERLEVTFVEDLQVLRMPVYTEEFCLKHFEGIVAFPERIQVTSGLSLTEILFFDGFPKKAIIEGDVTIRDTPITSVPIGWDIHGNADFSRNDFLKEVKVKHFYKNLRLEKCGRLKTLPTGLHVRGELDLEDCGRLRHLPKNLKVEGNLVIRGSAIKEIPPTAQIGGRIL